MKFATILSALPLASAAVLDTRQVNRAGQPKQALEPTMRKDAQRKFFTFGPYSLKPNNNAATSSGGQGHGGHGGGGMGGMGGMAGEEGAQSFFSSMSGAQFCGKCTVLSGQIKMTYADGSSANVSNGIYVHHVLTNSMITQPGFVRSMMSGIGGAGFVGAGDDNGNTPFIYAPRDGSIESGFYMKPEDKLTAQIVLVNYNAAPKTVYMNYDLEYMPDHVGKRVKSSLVSASGFGNPKASKSGAVNTTSSAMPFTEDGSIILAKGHLHDGGSAMYLKINGKTNYQCVSKATYGGKINGANTETISDMTDCNSGPVAIHAGDTMTMTAEYDLKAHPLRGTTSGGEGATMGLFRIIFAPNRNW